MKKCFFEFIIIGFLSINTLVGGEVILSGPSEEQERDCFSTLPVEMTCYIFGFLDKDKKSLLSLRGVCSKFKEILETFSCKDLFLSTSLTLDPRVLDLENLKDPFLRKITVEPVDNEEILKEHGSLMKTGRRLREIKKIRRNLYEVVFSGSLESFIQKSSPWNAVMSYLLVGLFSDSSPLYKLSYNDKSPAIVSLLRNKKIEELKIFCEYVNSYDRRTLEESIWTSRYEKNLFLREVCYNTWFYLKTLDLYLYNRDLNLFLSVLKKDPDLFFLVLEKEREDKKEKHRKQRIKEVREGRRRKVKMGGFPVLETLILRNPCFLEKEDDFKEVLKSSPSLMIGIDWGSHANCRDGSYEFFQDYGNSLFKFFADVPRLRSLSLKYNSGDSFFVQNEYFRKLSIQTHMTSLRLMFLFIQLEKDRKKEVIKDLSGALLNMPNLTDLVLSGNHIGDKEVEILANSLTNISRLTSLNLRSNTITGIGMKVLANALPSSLESLNLRGNKITDKDVEHLSNYLSNLPYLTKLNLHNNKINDVKKVDSLLREIRPSLKRLSI